jgi:PAS domain S-box-containing protein
VKARILVVEDEFITAADIENNLREMGFEVPMTVDSGEEAIQKAGEIRPDLIIMDITLKGSMTGIEAAREIQRLYGIPVVYLTAHSGRSMIDGALQTNPFGYIIKPFEASGLRAGIEMALYKHGMEETLRESRRTILCLLNAIGDALVLLDRDRKVIAVNEGMAREMGGDRDGLEGASLPDLMGTGILNFPDIRLDEVYKGGTPVSFEHPSDGRWFQIGVYPLTDAAGNVARVAVQFHDITELKRIEEQIQQEGLFRIEQNMEQFQILNDQIRNPLQVIRGYLDLSDSPFREKIEDQIRIIDDLVTRLDRGWVESEKVREFLMRHFWNGDESPPCLGGEKDTNLFPAHGRG